MMRPHGSPAQKLISNRLRQYMSLPLLKAADMSKEVKRIGDEIKLMSIQHMAPSVVRALNGLHNYVCTYWMGFHGAENISVYGCHHKTNNLAER